MNYFWIVAGVIAAAVALVAGLTCATLEVLARGWDPVGNFHAEDLAGRWIGISPAQNVIEILSTGREIGRR